MRGWRLIAVCLVWLLGACVSPGATALSQPSEAPPSGKRVALPVVPPVVMDGVRVVVVDYPRERGFSQGGGIIEGLDPASGKSLWTLKVYDISYEPNLETDIQDIPIVAMRPAGPHHLLIEDENHRRWLVDLATAQVSPK